MSSSESSSEGDGCDSDYGSCPEGRTADECVEETVSYHCPSCGNDSYGDIHDDCYGTCALCGYYFEWCYLKRCGVQGSIYEDERLCRPCLKEVKNDEEKPPTIKEPEVEGVDWSKKGVIPNSKT